MTTSQLGKLEPVDPRKIWADEAQDFTPWLAENLDRLSEELGMDLVLEGIETKVGDFYVDITATVAGRNANVIIENQLGATDHSHLGQLLTYASGQDADVIIWLTTEFRDEHRQAIDWLNQRTDDSLEFYAVTINVKRIGNSAPAPEFRPVAFPNTWQKAARTSDRELSRRERKYLDFFTTLIDELRTEHDFTNARKAVRDSWYGFPSGHTGILYTAAFGAKSRTRVEIYLDRDRDFNKRLFDSLIEKSADIERSIGEELSWERLDSRKACRVALYTEGSINGTDEDLAEVQSWMVKNLLKFKKVFGPYLESLV